MKTNWEVLRERVIQGNIDSVCDWLREFRKYPYLICKEYLEMDSDEPWLHEVIQETENKEAIKKFADLPEEYLVSIEDLKKVLYSELKES